MKLIAGRVAVFLSFFAVGFLFLSSKVDHFVINRDPAAIRPSYDLSHLQGEALSVALKTRVVAGFKVAHREDGIGFTLGHFAFINSKGEKTLACREFTRVVLKFEAEGVIVNGERPSMEVEGECRFSDDVALIDPLVLPVSRILGERPADGEFQFREQNPLAVRFSNLSDEWPRKWILTGVSLESLSQKMAIDRNELRRLMGYPLQIDIE